MKIRSFSVFLVAALCTALASQVAAAASAPATSSYEVGAVERYGGPVTRPGDSATKVAAFLGQPDQRLSGDTWVYRKFKSQPNPGHAADCTILLVTFKHDRVSDLRKVNEQAVQTIAAQLAAPVSPRKFVAGK